MPFLDFILFIIFKECNFQLETFNFLTFFFFNIHGNELMFVVLWSCLVAAADVKLNSSVLHRIINSI